MLMMNDGMDCRYDSCRRNGRMRNSCNALLLGFFGIEIGDAKLVNLAIAKGNLVRSRPRSLYLFIILLCPV